MEETKENPINNGVDTDKDPITGQFLPGNKASPGKPKGTNNFETDFDEAVLELAKENGMTRSEARKLLLKVAFNNAKEGNYSFYKDIHDRIYGKAKESLELGGEITIKIAKEVADKYEVNTSTGDNS